MAGKVPEGRTMNNDHGCGSSHTSSLLESSSSMSNASGMTAFQAQESNGNSSNLLPRNGTTVAQEEAEWVEQAEPGVYITVSASSGGGKHLKRVRFRYGHSFAFLWKHSTMKPCL